VRFAALLLSCVVVLCADSHVTYDCSPEDIEQFGLNCSEDEPCTVLLELSAAAAAANRIVVTGNLHTRDVTLLSLLLTSDDVGVTWTEPVIRMRNAAFEQIEFWDGQTGWVSGESINPLARNPFLLLTTDGGTNWRPKLIVDDEKFGAIAQFHFSSISNGEVVIDNSSKKSVHQELYGSETGGESWELKETANKPFHLNGVRAPNQAGYRVRADAAGGAYLLERGGGKNWEKVTSFPIHIADCH
jgi:photosystem II stability/assembly factor-like uncharacterized protein